MEDNQQPYKGKGSITKQEICQMYAISDQTLRNLFNKRYFEQLKAVGYSKQNKIITNRVFLKFIELYGEPL